jgi:hypothetical protein
MTRIKRHARIDSKKMRDCHLGGRLVVVAAPAREALGLALRRSTFYCLNP